MFIELNVKINEHKVIILKPGVMFLNLKVKIFCLSVKWPIKFLKNDIMFFKFNVMFLTLQVMFFLHRIMFTSLRIFRLGCGAIFVIYEKAYTKMAPQGCNHLIIVPKSES